MMTTWWTPCVPTLCRLLLSVQLAGGHDCPRCEWFVDLRGRRLPWRETAKQARVGDPSPTCPPRLA